MGAGDRGPRPGDWRRIWLTPRAIGLHVTLLIVVPGFVALFWWQVQRVRQGNELSWAYVFEWPFFTGYAVYLWWRLVHEQPSLTGGVGDGRPHPEVTNGNGSGATSPSSPPEPGQEDAELAAYNRYLADLAARDAEQERG